MNRTKDYRLVLSGGIVTQVHHSPTKSTVFFFLTSNHKQCFKSMCFDWVSIHNSLDSMGPLTGGDMLLKANMILVIGYQFHCSYFIFVYHCWLSGSYSIGQRFCWVFPLTKMVCIGLFFVEENIDDVNQSRWM